ncbi:MAG TPA: ferric reductase-like transmembrane domain-containing protein [Dermatophilaceae bacterium]|nr:ferric reductase-like transmembrane domain-containing protein [Dermatophilaceae bacterium]
MTGTAFWYASRATGVISLILFSLVAILGILVNRQGRLPGLPRFAVTGLHRNLSLLTVAFLGTHIVTAIVDGYAHIPWMSTVVPFSSGYERFWIGLGTVAVDLFAALIVTSLLRDRLKPSVWRAVHWLAYVSYPVIVVHSLGASKDLRSGWLLALTMATVFAVISAIGYRVLDAFAAVPRPGRVPEQFQQTDQIRTDRIRTDRIRADRTGSVR